MNNKRPEDAGEFFLRLIEYFHKKLQPRADIFKGNFQSHLRANFAFNHILRLTHYDFSLSLFPRQYRARCFTQAWRK